MGKDGRRLLTVELKKRTLNPDPKSLQCQKQCLKKRNTQKRKNVEKRTEE